MSDEMDFDDVWDEIGANSSMPDFSDLTLLGKVLAIIWIVVVTPIGWISNLRYRYKYKNKNCELPKLSDSPRVKK